MNIGNEEMLKGIKTFERTLGSIVVNPHHLEDSIKWLDIAAGHPRVAHVTLGPDTTYEQYDSPAWLRLFAEIAARNLAVFWNTSGPGSCPPRCSRNRQRTPVETARRGAR